MALSACGAPASPSATLQASATTEPAGLPPDFLAVVCAFSSEPFDPDDVDINGAWAGDDGGIYYLRQVGSLVWWNGMSGRDGSPLELGRDWNNVARGEINGLQIEVEWSDVPRGEVFGHGTLGLEIQDDGTGNVQIVKVRDIEGFGNEVWTPCSPVELQVAAYFEAYGGDPSRYADILTSEVCAALADREDAVTTTLNTAQAGSSEFRQALGYSNAIDERQLLLDC